MLKYIKYYRFRSIFLKNMCVAAILLLIPFLLTLFLLKNAYDRVWEAEQNKNREAVVAQVESNINDIMGELYLKMLLLQGDKNVKLFSYTNADRPKGGLYAWEDILEMLQVMSSTSNYMKNIYLYAAKNNNVMAKEGYGSWKKEDFHWVQEDLKLGIYHETGTNVNTSKIYIYNILNAKKVNQLTIIYEMDGTSFRNKICGESDNLVELILHGVNVWTSKEISSDEQEKYVYVERDLNTEGMTLRVYFEKDTNTATFKGIMQMQRLSVVVLMCMMLLVIWLLSVRMYYPVRMIMETLEDYETSAVLAGERSGLIENKNELECILNAFYQETDKKRRAESELNERIVMMKSAQMVALQAQINPHFIFNTLDAINWMALKHLGKRNEVSLMTSELAKMIRLSSENANTLIPLEKEIEYASIYVRIMQVRCDNKFQVQWDIPDSLRQYNVVKLTLQPLIENAVNHGALKLKEASVIHVSAYVQDGMLYISVKDSGPGIQQQDLEILRNRLVKEKLQEDKHFGLSNVNRRLRIMFGEKSGISVVSKLGCGTEVTITIPIDMDSKRE